MQERVHRWGVSLALGGLVVLSALVTLRLTTPWPETPDGFFHLQRVRALAEALRWGVLFPRWFPDFAFGYGYPVLHFYAPLFYYLPVLFHLAGWDVIAATRLALALLTALSGLAAYALLRLWVRPWAAFVGASVYVWFPYRWYDVLVRGALPEAAALTWLPLVVLGTVLVERTWRTAAAPRSHRAAALVTAVLAWTGLILTHNLTAWMTALGLGVVVVGQALRRWGRGQPARSAWVPVLPLALGGALAGFFVVPVFLEMPWVGIGQANGGSGYARHFRALADLFTWAPAYPYPAADVPSVPVPGYAAVLLGVACVLLLWPRVPRRWVLGGWTAAVLGTLALTTSASAAVWRLAGPLLRPLQFPWRWQALTALALAALLALLWDLWHPPRRTTLLLSLALALYFALYAWGALPTPASVMAPDQITPEAMWAFDAAHGQVGATWTAEFLPRWVTEQRWAIGRAPTTPQALPATPPLREVWLEEVGYLTYRGRYDAASPTRITFHIFYYPAWEVRVDGQAVPVAPITNLGLLSAQVPAGRHAFEVRWRPTPAVWIGRFLTLVGWLAVAGLWLWGRPRGWRLGLVLWLIVGLIGGGVAGGLWERTRPLRPVNAHYGPLTLSAADIPDPQGMTVRVRLFWLVRRPTEPVTAFVHVVDERGRLVAQHDGPLGTPYTPPARWLPNFLLPDPHPVRLSADLKAGRYTLKAGLYRPAWPDQRLPADRTDPDGRIPLGTLEVRP